MNKGNRRTIRLSGYDYAQDGWYFITICTEGFKEIFGNIDVQGTFIPNLLGKIVLDELNHTANLRNNVFIDEFQLMPNHFHFIIIIGSKEKLPNISGFPNTSSIVPTFKSPSKTIGAIIRGIKGASNKKINLIDKTLIDRIWQKNYYERIIRNPKELENIRIYIKNNPKKWMEDKSFFIKLLQKME